MLQHMELVLWTAYILNQGMFYLAAYLTFFLFGILVLHGVMRVHYARKFCGFVFFSLGYILYANTPWFGILGSLLSVMLLALFFLSMAEPLRRRVHFLYTCFAAINRPEDAPYTLRLILSEFFVQYAMILLCLKLYATLHLPSALVYLAVLLVAFGDGMAEIVGTRFGKHFYHVPKLWGTHHYHRSIEGSVAMWLVALILVENFRWMFLPHEYAYALLIIPLAATLAEAVSPHTWDGPAIHFATAASIVGITSIS